MKIITLRFRDTTMRAVEWDLENLNSEHPLHQKVFPLSLLNLLLLGASNCLHGMPRSRRVMGLFWSDWREAAVLFVTYLWGKPQLPTCRENAEGAKLPH